MPQKFSRSGTPWIPLLVWGTLIYIFIRTYSVTSHIIISFLLIMLLTLALNPVVIWLRRMIGTRTLATGVVVLLFLIVAGLTGYAFYRPVKSSVKTFVERLPDYWERIQKPLVRMEQKAAIKEEKLKNEVSQEIEK